MLTATGLPYNPAPLGKTPISWLGGSWAASTHTGNDLDPRSSTLFIASAHGLPLLSGWRERWARLSSCHIKGPIAAHRSTDAAFFSPVPDGGSIWGLCVSLFFFFSPWLLLLLSSIFNFLINQRIVLYLAPFFSLESASHCGICFLWHLLWGGGRGSWVGPEISALPYRPGGQDGWVPPRTHPLLHLTNIYRANPEESELGM